MTGGRASCTGACSAAERMTAGALCRRIKREEPGQAGRLAQEGERTALSLPAPPSAEKQGRGRRGDVMNVAVEPAVVIASCKITCIAFSGIGATSGLGSQVIRLYQDLPNAS